MDGTSNIANPIELVLLLIVSRWSMAYKVYGEPYQIFLKFLELLFLRYKHLL